MNDINLLILVSLLVISLALIIGYVWGFRNGAKDERNESEFRATRIARRRVQFAGED